MSPPHLTPRSAFTIFLVLAVFFLVYLRRDYSLSDALLSELLDAYIDNGVLIEQKLISSASNDGETRARSTQASHLPLPTFNPYLKPLLECHHKPNKQGQILLPARHLNICVATDEHPSPQYFNPTIIPLPSYAAALTSARYLLVTRLVTSGLHQESHVCLASFCLPSLTTTTHHNNDNSSVTVPRVGTVVQRHLPPDTSPCTPQDHTVLGLKGGLRCIHPAKPVNIPPTPSLKCADKWSPFPDIPGFHDPRIMWSGRGEPLIVVNSGSTYGCVGLWMMDLRVLSSELRDVLERRKRPEITQELQQQRHHHSGVDGGDRLKKRGENDAQQEDHERGGATPWWKTPVVRFDTLTELTRWEGRVDVEKNWMLWWPGDGRRTRVSYEMFGRWEEDGTEEKNNSSESDTEHNDIVVEDEDGGLVEGAETRLGRGGNQTLQNSAHELMPWPVTNVSRLSNSSHIVLALEINQSIALAAEHISLDNNTHILPSSYNLTTSLSSTSPNTSSLNTSVELSTNQIVPQPIKKRSAATPTASLPVNSRPSGETNPPPSSDDTKPNPLANYTFHSGRSTSELHYGSHHLIALPNSTHPHEPPCLLPPDLPLPSSSSNKKASTHQSTPALRLILCQRNHSDPSCAAYRDTTASATTQREWLDSGREVHFSIVHRKLRPENPLGLVGRGGYERWVVVWEGREPGRVVAVGRFSLVFEGEGWEGADAGGGHNDGEEKGGSNSGKAGHEHERRGESTTTTTAETGFVYTTSISWAWRVDGGPIPRGDGSDDGPGGEEDRDDIAHLSSLGTGFLGDDVIIGIGIDDVRQAVVRIKVDELLSCMTLCPGVVVDAVE